MKESCTCGATDCEFCGPAQGYQVHRIRNNRGDYVWVNPEDEDEDGAMSSDCLFSPGDE